MSWLLDNLSGVVYWLAIVGGLAWWVRSMRRPAGPATRKRTPEEEVELERLQLRLRTLRAE